MISIHAPLTGSDPGITSHKMWDNRFQSTLPLRGATIYYFVHFSTHRNFNPRSPYGERRSLSVMPPSERNFNPRSPYGERPEAGLPVPVTRCISIHAPLTGSDWICCGVDHPAMISIHAPLTGSDQERPGRRILAMNFNPRSPYGERQASLDCGVNSQGISIHAPLTGSDKQQHIYP